MKKLLIVLLLLTCSLAFSQQAINGNRYILGYWNASGATWTMPFRVATSQPGTCTLGEVMFDSDATAGQNIYLCSATNTWTQVRSATPGGTTGNVQYNDGAGGFGAEAALSYNTTTNTLKTGKVTISDACTLGAATTLETGTLCFDVTDGLLASDGLNWYTANWSQNATGEILYSGAAYQATTESGFSYNASTNTLTAGAFSGPLTCTDCIALGSETSGNYAGSSSEGGAATTATALAANGSNCSAGSYPLGVDASGAVESCTAVSGSNLWLTIDTASGTDLAADNTADTLVLAAGTGISITGDGTNTATIASTVTDTDDQNLWLTVDTSSGTDVTADSSGDTLVLSGGTGITVTGDGTNTVTIASTVTDTGDELTVDDTATTTPDLTDDASSDVDFSYNGTTHDITATVKANSVALGTDTTGNYAGSSSEGGAATTATALAADPADCGANTWATTIAASGALTCSAVSGGAGITDGTILEADLTWDSTATRTAGQSVLVGTDTTKFTTGVPATATALAANPSACTAGQYVSDIAADGTLTCSVPAYKLLSAWHRENIAADATVYMSPVDAATNLYLPFPVAVTLYALACTNSAIITAGTITFTVESNGSNSDLTVQQTTGTGSGAVLSDTTCTSNCAIGAGEKVRIVATSAGTVAPTTTDPNCTLLFTIP